MELDWNSSRDPYFGYGSNLWQEQMRRRCPGSQYLGIARLSGFHWVINERGYANVIPSSSTSQEIADSSTSNAISDTSSQWRNLVYGLVYSLTRDDEDRLDINEGVPFAYVKEVMEVEFWPAGKTDSSPPEKKRMLVYIDRQRVKGGFAPRKEYIKRMNMGIRDALSEGVPQDYVRTVLREYIPEQEAA